MSTSTRARRSASRSTGSRGHATRCCADRLDSVIHAGNSARVRWLAGSLALGLAVLAAFLWRRRCLSGAAGAAPRPAHLLALAELERLERELPVGRSASEEFYVRLADILRRYALGRFGLSAPTQTTEELLAAVDRTGGPVAARQQLIGGVLAQCDLVKFARRQPTPATAPGSLREARTFVEQTAAPHGAGAS